MLLAELVETSRRVSESPGRLDKIAELARCIERLSPDESEIGVAYLSGELRQGKIGVGHATVSGLFGDVSRERATLELCEVDRALREIAEMSGRGSTLGRAQALEALMQRATRSEQSFLKCLLLGEIRQGALEGIMVDAVARAFHVKASVVRRALMLSGQMSSVVRALVEQGAAGLDRFHIQLFRPLQPMLAQTADNVAEAVERVGRAALEYKLDGARVQVHRDGDEVRVYTRNLNDVTSRVPEIVDAVLAMPLENVVLDGEAISLQKNGTPQPFQITMRRFGRRLDVERLKQSLPLKSFFFDCLYLNGQDLIDQPYEERLRATSAVVGELAMPRRIVSGEQASQEFLEDALQVGHEGIMVKALDSTYEAGRRGASWLKVKPTHTLDLVVLAAEWGSGRRRGWLSNLHLGARDPELGGYVMLGKTFKGMTDQMLTWQTERLLELEVARDSYTVFVRPELVVEIAFDGVQASSQYAGGLALRFARVKRYRSDKLVEDSDTIDRVRAIYARRSG